MSLVALCADETSLAHPELIGLEGENLTAQNWLRLFSFGEQARVFLREDRLVDEVWVVSAEDLAPINLAATLKADRSDRRVCLITFQETGSLRSRASAAGIDATMTRQAFVTRYTAFKRVRGSAGKDAGTMQGDCSSPKATALVSKQAWPSLPFVPEEPKDTSGIDKVNTDTPEPLAEEGLPSSRTQSIVAPAASVRATRGALLPIVSGSGGSGKSSVAALAAMVAQRRGRKTLLLDFDLQFGDMRELLGQAEALGIDEILADPSRLSQLSAPAGMPTLIGSPRHLEEAERIAQQAPALLEALLSMFEVVIANTGAAWADQHAVLLERCTKTLFLIDQRASSLRACKRALDLCARCGIAATPFLFAVNFCSKSAPLTSIDVSCALRGVEVLELSDGGAEVEEVLSEGRPLDLWEMKNPLCQDIEAFLSGVLPVQEGEPAAAEIMSTSRRGLFGRRRRRKRAVL